MSGARQPACAVRPRLNDAARALRILAKAAEAASAAAFAAMFLLFLAGIFARYVLAARSSGRTS